MAGKEGHSDVVELMVITKAFKALRILIMQGSPNCNTL